MEIYLYDGSNTIQLTDNYLDDDGLQINDTGDVVWCGYNGNDREIYLYDGSNTIQLTDNNFDDLYPQINNNGDVVWTGYNGNYEIYLHDGSTTIQLTDSGYNSWPQINNNGDVVWVGGIDNCREIYLAKPGQDPSGGGGSGVCIPDTDNGYVPNDSGLHIKNINPAGGAGCFIATAAYGSYMEPHVMTLRQFRDSYLLTNKLGTKFVEVYYKYSPPMADFIAEHDALRSVARIGLAPLVGFSWLAVNYGVMAALAFLFGLLTLLISGTCFMVKSREAN
jgi:hypothetical protein